MNLKALALLHFFVKFFKLLTIPQNPPTLKKERRKEEEAGNRVPRFCFFWTMPQDPTKRCSSQLPNESYSDIWNHPKHLYHQGIFL